MEALQDAGDGAAALAIVRRGSGLLLMNEFRMAADVLSKEEQRLLGLRLSKANRTNISLLVANLTGIAFIIALAAVVILAVRRTAEDALRQSEKRGDELQVAVNELESFSYSVSHDLRAPLRAIDGFSRLVLKQQDPALGPEAREHLRSVCENAVQMGHLVDDLLAFSRLGRRPLNKREVPTTAIVEQALREVQQKTRGRTVTVSVGHVPPVCCDEALLRQVFRNLIDNAFKYTRRRDGAMVEIGSHNTGSEQVFFVRDNGAGFDMRYADKLFNVFHRLHRAEDFEGTGAGLAIVRRIIERHGGRVWAEAAVDQGATFYFTTEAPAHG